MPVLAVFYLAKGEYFRKTGNVFVRERELILVRWGGYRFSQELKKRYGINNSGRNPFEDLAQNSGIENINKECFIVHGSAAHQFVFFLNATFAIFSEVLPKSDKNIHLQRKNKAQLIKGFATGKCNESVV